MPSRQWLKGQEIAEEERHMEELNASLERTAKREKFARDIATEMFQRDDDVVVDDDASVEYVDGGYWVTARVFVEADVVEDAMRDEPGPWERGDHTP